MSSTAPELEAILADLEAAVTAQAAVRLRRMRRRRIVLALPVAAAVAVALVVGLGVGNEQPAAARGLSHAASLVADDPAPVIGAGQYWYVKAVGSFANTLSEVNGESFTAQQVSTHQIWIAKDGGGRVLRTDGAPRFFSDAERARWVAAGSPGFASSPLDETNDAPGSFTFGWDELGVHAGTDIPTDPAVLGALVAAHATGTGNPLAYEEFTVIGDVLRFAPLSGAQTGAFYKVLATLPGIELIGPTTDSLGRAGVAFGVERAGDPTREELIVDPTSGKMLGTRTTLTVASDEFPGATAGTTLDYEAVESTGVVDSTEVTTP